ncbi:GGDEF domain-containing protein [Bacillus sp. 31A1R]|uniref:GGDEF domain-containing protein n=1 Tax=Robertmurraya mangrovi TaxID=3098077 RepID=A0ABU5J2C9_9BACI|nr:GGDEF domain-containing protein [Bacillus sp. 31A1R]MDZ5473568.1 GGDEF domain-containing protein [Bacillus sp. 31A1R]
MVKARIFDFSLFFTAVIIAFVSGSNITDLKTYGIALLIYWIFSSLYYPLRIEYKSGNTSIDYGISYSLSFALFAGPLGLLIYEIMYGISVYVYRRWTNRAIKGDFLDSFYNVGSFVLSNTICYYLFINFNPLFNTIPYGFMILIFLLVIVNYFISSTLLVTVFFILGEMKTLNEAISFYKNRPFLDTGKIAITNGLLYLFLQQGQWEMLFSMFLLNYIVSRSFYSKTQSIQNKIERDKFEQMAYTDFLTGVSNRAYMDKKMAELKNSSKSIGIVVTDIDKFKKINDTYNHAIGDQVIKHFATTLKNNLTDKDILFRSGGEEFTIFLREKSPEECESLIESIRQRLEEQLVEVEFNTYNLSISYTASFGLYYHESKDQVSLEKAYIFADQLMLQSKQVGRNKLTVSTR